MTKRTFGLTLIAVVLTAVLIGVYALTDISQGIKNIILIFMIYFVGMNVFILSTKMKEHITPDHIYGKSSSCGSGGCGSCASKDLCELDLSKVDLS